MRSAALAGVGVVAALALTSTASATPQVTVGFTIGAAGVSPEAAKPLAVSVAGARAFWRQTDFHLGMRSDVLFGRAKASDFGVGPFVETLTNGFDEIQFGGGVSGLIPIVDTFPIVLSAGGYGRLADDGAGVTPGVSGQLFWGSRSYNFHGKYVLALGLLAQLRYGLGDNKETAVVIGAQLDVVALSLPFLFLVNAARGGSPATRNVK